MLSLPIAIFLLIAGPQEIHYNPPHLIVDAPQRCATMEMRYAPQNKVFCDGWIDQKMVALSANDPKRSW